ncbi:hypothetical protein LTR56_004926 [Elasticomyces elasticus]|nr:hypothetical protein LTR56_004926 [Elasticomyces elasticus]KAK3664698.1 hypothetical protein LTR22_004568 [Elasticomyces elasticus]KAK4913713.1 hypothetical protein LTR49_017968 [Elasticomyces elasticus]KAK5754767.1 hypothetical protein LTS12_015178 [Elasticomyces elasticus]
MAADRRPSKQANRRSSESTLEQVVANGEMLPEGLGDSARTSSGTEYHQNARDGQLTRKRRRESDDSTPVSAAIPSPSPTLWVMPIFPTSGAPMERPLGDAMPKWPTTGPPMERPPPHPEHGTCDYSVWHWDHELWELVYADGWRVTSAPLDPSLSAAGRLIKCPSDYQRTEVGTTEHEMAYAPIEQAAPDVQHINQAPSEEFPPTEAGANEDAEFINRFEEMGVEDGGEGRDDYWKSGGDGDISGILSDIDYEDELETREAISDSEDE